MTTEQIFEGIARLPVQMQRRLLRHLRRSLKKCPAKEPKPVPLWKVQRDPIFYTWLLRIYQLSIEDQRSLVNSLRRLIIESKYEHSLINFYNLDRLLSIFNLPPETRVSYEDFLEARREAWHKWLRESE